MDREKEQQHDEPGRRHARAQHGIRDHAHVGGERGIRTR